jgi:hypothetical protein
MASPVIFDKPTIHNRLGPANPVIRELMQRDTEGIASTSVNRQLAAIRSTTHRFCTDAAE